MNYIVLDMEWNQPGYADTALCRTGEILAHEPQRKTGLAEELTENHTRTGTAEKGCGSRTPKTLAGTTAEADGGETEQPTTIALRMDGPGNGNTLL